MTDAYSAALAAIESSIDAMTPAEAGQKLAELGAIYRGTPDHADVIKMEPRNAIEAHRKLSAMQNNPQWRDRFFEGNARCREEFETLTKLIAAGDDVDFALAGVRPEFHINTNAGASLADMTSAAAHMRTHGLTRSGIFEFLAKHGIEAKPDASEISIRTILGDKTPSADAHEWGKAEQARLMADKDWQARLNAGDPLARTELLVMSWAIGCFVPGVP